MKKKETIEEGTKLVAEIGINHNGNLHIAKSLIDLAHNFGCHYVKFQKKTPDICVPENQKNMIINTVFGHPMKYIEYKNRMEFTEKQYGWINKYCKEIGIKWYASVWDVPSVEFMKKFNPPFLKIPSALITNIDLIESCKDTGIPCIISTGMSIGDEIHYSVANLGNNLKYILHTTSSYPTPNGEMNMRKMITLYKNYGNRYKIGFSNHCADLIYIIQAYVMGAEMIEFHITLDRNLPGTDQMASIGPTGLDKIMKHLTNITRGWGDGNLTIQESEYPIREKLRGNISIKIDEYRPMVGFIKDREKNKKLIGIEIGVKGGRHAKTILDNLNMKKLYLVDPYETITNYYPQQDLISFQQILKTDVLDNYNNCELVKMTSNDAMKYIPNELDFVYIDGDHSYEAVTQDINNYYKKLRTNGVIGGHDYTHPLFPGVRKAVDEFIEKNKLKLYTKYTTFPSLHKGETEWWVIKGEKKSKRNV